MFFRRKLKPQTAFFQCANSRSGSTYLAALLRSTGQLGLPNEYANGKSVRVWAEKLGVSSTEIDRKYVAALLRERVTENGVFGIKATPPGYLQLEKYMVFTHHIYLLREDTLRQAISLYRAEATGQFSQMEKEAYDRMRENNPGTNYPTISDQPAPTEIPFDREAILKCLKRIQVSNQQWEEIFKERGIEPLRLTYDQLCAAPGETVQQVADYLQVPLSEGTAPKSGTVVMRDELTEEWVRRLQAEPSLASGAETDKQP